MKDQNTGHLYRVWGADKTVHGPVEPAALALWIKEQRLQPDSWVFVEEAGRWTIASRIRELKALFEQAGAPPPHGNQAAKPVKAANLKRIRAFDDLPLEHLEALLGYLQVVEVPKFTPLFRRGDPGDAMYFVLSGEVRASTMIEGHEVLLFKMGAGESFGELALLIQDARTADATANEDSILLKLSAAAFETIVQDWPEIAAPVLMTLCRTITFRSLELGKQREQAYQRALRLAQVHP